MATIPLCKIDGCCKPVKYSGMCSMHAERTRKHGSPALGVFKPKGTCTIPDCGRTHYAQGYCLKHYKRWAKYGDPLGGSTEWGAAQRFIAEAVASDTDECLVFPFYRNADGYGWMNTPTGHLGAHVYAAILAHGEKPSPLYEACHNCGNGSIGCVNPRHIYWGTRSDNLKDAYAHGAMPRSRPTGEMAFAARYSDEVIQQVRDALARGERQTAIAKRLNISQSHVSRIKHGARSPRLG
jgi:hypothetical protein